MDHTICENYYANIGNLVVLTFIEDILYEGYKFLAKLYKRYGDWGKVCGYYNTGKPIINDYAHYAVNNKNYKSKWVEVEL